jgi:hypothetical protein
MEAAQMSEQESSLSAEADFGLDTASPDPGLVREYLAFLRHNKKWWLLPVLVVLLLVGALVMVGGTAAAPFIYSLF